MFQAKPFAALAATLLTLPQLTLAQGAPTPVALLPTGGLNFGNRTAARVPSPGDTLVARLVNRTTAPVKVTDVNTFRRVFSVRDTSFTVQPGDTARITVRFASRQNLTYRDVLLVETDGAGSVSLPLAATARYADAFYAPTQNLTDEPLKAAIRSLVLAHTDYGYSGIRPKMFGEIEPKLTSTGLIECVYTGRQTAPNGTNTPGGFNTEHTWPQSLFSQREPERSDINHLFPTDDGANNDRSNYPFGIVTSVTRVSAGSPAGPEPSKLGTNAAGQIVYEPRDRHKGDVARAMFYMATVYENDNITLSYMNSAGQQAVLRDWNRTDTVSAKEALRNQLVTGVQGKPNPFIDHPEFAERITDFAVNTSKTDSTRQLTLPAGPLRFPTVAVGDSVDLPVAVVSTGNASATITSATISGAGFRLINAGALTVGPYAATSLVVRFRPTADGLTNGTLTVQSSGAAPMTVQLSGIASGSVAVGPDASAPARFHLLPASPNPFNPTTTIGYQLSAVGTVRLDVYDALGRRVRTLVDERQSAGPHSVTFDASGLPSGLYLARLSAAGQVATERLMLVR